MSGPNFKEEEGKEEKFTHFSAMRISPSDKNKLEFKVEWENSPPTWELYDNIKECYDDINLYLQLNKQDALLFLKFYPNEEVSEDIRTAIRFGSQEYSIVYTIKEEKLPETEIKPKIEFKQEKIPKKETKNEQTIHKSTNKVDVKPEKTNYKAKIIANPEIIQKIHQKQDLIDSTSTNKVVAKQENNKKSKIEEKQEKNQEKEKISKSEKKQEAVQKKEKKKESTKRDIKNINMLERSEQTNANKTRSSARLDRSQRNILEIEIPEDDPFKTSTDNSLILKPLDYPRKIIKILKFVRELPRFYVIVQFADQEAPSKLDIQVARFICPELLADFLLTRLKEHSINNH